MLEYNKSCSLGIPVVRPRPAVPVDGAKPLHELVVLDGPQHGGHVDLGRAVQAGVDEAAVLLILLMKLLLLLLLLRL